MDLNNLKDTVSNLTLYDLKAGVRKVQNAVMNYTEMEAKVREATNNEPWGASSTLMQEIANGTFNYSTLNEIMPMIYRRFTEKSAEEWRQIYKGLQLLEFLVKHGSERVIDDARSHLTLLKMLRQFHFIDQNGKDQGVNVRNRAKELAELLGDVDRIRAERKKARSNRQKYAGVEGGASFGGGFSSSGGSSRHGGFGSESGGRGGGGHAEFGGYSGGVYGDGGGFGGQASDFRDTQARGDKFQEYDEFEERERPATASSSRTTKRTAERAGTKKATPPPKKQPEADLFSFDEPATSAIPTAPLPVSSSGSGLASLTSPVATNDDDEFDDFQSATPVTQSAATQRSFTSALLPPVAPTQSTTPKPVSTPQQANLSSMVAFSISTQSSSINTPVANLSAFKSPMPTGYSVMSPLQSTQQSKPAGFQAATPNYFSSVPLNTQQTGTSLGGKPPSGAPPANKSAAMGGDAFGALWSHASVGVKKASTPGTGPAIGQLAKEKSAADIWGASAPGAATAKPMGSPSQPVGGAFKTGSSGLDDLLG